MRVTLFMSVSINGMIARLDGRGDFFTGICWRGFVEIVREKGALIWGRTTHEIARPWGSFNRDLVGTPVRGVVLTGNRSFQPEPSWETAPSPEAAISQLRERGLDEVIVAGGTTANTAFLREGLIDQVTIFVEGNIIGSGLPLVHPDSPDIALVLVEARPLTDTVARLDLVVRR